MRFLVIILAVFLAIGPAGPMLAMVNGAPCCADRQGSRIDHQTANQGRECPLCVGATGPGDGPEQSLPGPEGDDTGGPCSTCRCCALPVWVPTLTGPEHAARPAPVLAVVAPRQAATRALETPTPPPRASV